MSEKVLLSTAFVKTVKSPKSGRDEYKDLLCKGLYLRVAQSGTKSWSILYRVAGGGDIGDDGNLRPGKTQRFNLGQYPTVGLQEAREKAAAVWENAKEKGIDPKLQRQKDIIEHRAAAQNTFRAVAEEYLSDAETGTQKVGSRRDGTITPATTRTRQLDLEQFILPRMGDIPITDLAKRDVVSVLNQINDKAFPTRVDRALTTIRAVFNFAKLRGIIDENPAASIGLRRAPVKRERVLGSDEIRALWTACGAEGKFGHFVRVLLLTGQRRNEVARMQWEHLDLDEKIWHLPAALTKSKRGHEIPLSGSVVEILDQQSEDGPYVFGSRARRDQGGNRRGVAVPMSGFSKRKLALDKAFAAHLEREPQSWRLHDLRRTCATGLAEAGEIPPVISLVLNHSVGATMGITSVYNRHQYTEEKRNALDKWARRVAEIVNPPPEGDGAKIIQFEQRSESA